MKVSKIEEIKIKLNYVSKVPVCTEEMIYTHQYEVDMEIVDQKRSVHTTGHPWKVVCVAM